MLEFWFFFTTTSTTGCDWHFFVRSGFAVGEVTFFCSLFLVWKQRHNGFWHPISSQFGLESGIWRRGDKLMGDPHGDYHGHHHDCVVDRRVFRYWEVFELCHTCGQNRKFDRSENHYRRAEEPDNGFSIETISERLIFIFGQFLRQLYQLFFSCLRGSWAHWGLWWRSRSRVDSYAVCRFRPFLFLQRRPHRSGGREVETSLC